MQTRRIVRLILATLALVSANNQLGAQDTSRTPNANQRDRIVEQMVHSTVQIRCETTGPATQPMGSGVVVGDARTVVTNEHVLEGCNAQQPGSRVHVQAWDGAAVPATVIRAFPGADVGVLQLAGTLPVVVAQLRSDGTAKVMETVVAVGYPGLAAFAGVSGQQGRTTIGVISRVAAQDLVGAEPRWVLEHGAPIYPGNSGGPLFDECGAVLGINTFVPVDRRTQSGVPTIAYAVGSRTIQRVTSEVTSAALSLTTGACGQSLTSDARQQMLTENASAASDSAVRKFYTGAIRRIEGWQRNFERKAAARDSAIGDAISMVGEQAANAQRTSDGLQGRIADLESRWTTSEQRWEKELQWQRIGLIVIGLLGLAALGLGARSLIRASRIDRQLHMVKDDVRVVGEQAADARSRADAAMDLARQAMEAAERAAQQGADPHVREEVQRIWSALDKRDSHSVLLMSPADRTKILSPETNGAPNATDTTLEISDDEGQRTVMLRAGTTLYLGRDAAAMQLVARRYLVPHIEVAIRESGAEHMVSRCHCSIAHRGDHLEVVDLSSNGTYLDATRERLAFGQVRKVARGESLRLARPESLFQVRLGAGAPATVKLN